MLRSDGEKISEIFALFLSRPRIKPLARGWLVFVIWNMPRGCARRGMIKWRRRQRGDFSSSASLLFPSCNERSSLSETFLYSRRPPSRCSPPFSILRVLKARVLPPPRRSSQATTFTALSSQRDYVYTFSDGRAQKMKKGRRRIAKRSDENDRCIWKMHRC